MAYAGQIIENAVSGERITFERTAADTDGELLAFQLELSADGHVPGMHVHPSQEERFEVVAGRMRFRQGLRTVVAEPGDVVVVEPGISHKFVNAGDEPAVAKVEVRPALEMERLLETAGGARRGWPHHQQGHAQAARPGPVHARVPRRGQGAVSAGVCPARRAGTARLGGPQARSRRSLCPRPSAMA